MKNKKKPRKKTLKKAEPLLRISERLGEVIGEAAVVGKREAKRTGRHVASKTLDTVDTLVEKGKDIIRTTSEVMPQVARELRKGINKGIKKARKKR